MSPSAIQLFIRILVGLLPVYLFLAALIFLDSYKLVRLRSVLLAILAGCIASSISFLVNSRTMQLLEVDLGFYSRYGAPVVEEVLKSIYLVYLIKSKRIGFMVDGAIFGFAIGAGFAFVENIYYLQSLSDPNLLLWIVRGFGTAIMHGGTTAVLGIVSRAMTDRKGSDTINVFLPGICIAIVIHSFFNHFILPPEISTLCLLLVLPPIIIIVFNQSEKATRHWLGVGFDMDVELLSMIVTGDVSETKIGRYLQSLKSRFPGEVVADMLCLLRMHLELTTRAKGILLMHEAGFKIAADPEIKAKLDELKYLEKSIGKTGQLAIAPFLRTSSRDLWQLYMLGKK